MQAETSSASLSPGTLIGRYEIREVLGVGVLASPTKPMTQN